MRTRSIRILPVVYVTKYALTQGIWKFANAEMDSSISSTMISIKARTALGQTMHFHKPDWYEDELEARLRVVDMKNAKVKSLERAIAKLEKLNPMQMPIEDYSCDQSS